MAIGSVEGVQTVVFPVAYLAEKTYNIDLAGSDGNAFSIAAIGKRWLAQLEMRDLQKQFTDEIFSGDYDNVLKTMDKWFDTSLLQSFRDGFDDYEDDLGEDEDDGFNKEYKEY